MSKTYQAVIAIVIIVVVGYAGWYAYQARRIHSAGILSEKIVHDGDLWTADYTARIAAPEPAVYDAMQNIEKSRAPGVDKIKVIAQGRNTKTIEMDLDGFGGQTMAMQLAFTYDPATERISYRTVDNPMLDSRGDYQLEADGATATLITYHATTKMLQSMPVPDGIVKSAIRGIFIYQLEGLKNTLHVTTADRSDNSDEEP
ncbi:MAG TPA: SRPBCC family protein [Candidatus Binataceae bacterium]|nr:SRPBCC family protein [Candidatus Binataceae bacterium]